MNKKLIFVIGGAAALYFLFWRKKRAAQTMPSMPVSPDQELAPTFVQTSKKLPVSRSSRKRKIAPASELMTVANEMRMDDMQVEPGVQIDKAAPIVLSRKDARQEARSVKQQIRSSGGSGKQARQAARTVRKEARQARRMGEISVLF